MNASPAPSTPRTTPTASSPTPLADQAEPSAWFVAVGPERPLPRTAPPLAREKAPGLCAMARARSQHLTRNPLAVGPLTGLEIVSANPPARAAPLGLQLPLRTGREIYTELHHEGSTVLPSRH
ncbi:hypothetical protein [Streptomyces flaveolus]|uniref:hypothetical protein n=1 Tax=Streptomyces flaveolus TaxID=67297 RepID=UPI003316C571